MNPLEQGLAVGLGISIIGIITAICLRSPSRTVSIGGKQVYRIHGVWFVFSAVGGAFLAGLFALGATFSPDQRAFCLGCAALSVVFFAFFAFVMRSLSVTLDEERVTAGTLFGSRSVELRNVDRVMFAGLVVEVRQREDPVTKKRGRPLTFLVGFRGVQDLVAAIRARSGALAPQSGQG